MRILTIIAIPVMLMLTLGLVSSQEKISRADRTHMRETRETMRSVALSLRTLQQMSEDGAYPTELKALVENELAESVPKDGWGRDFAYQRSTDGDFELTSWGADGKAGGDGAARDIVWTAQGELRKMSSEEKEAFEKRREEQRFQGARAVAREKMIQVGNELVRYRRDKGEWPKALADCRREGTEAEDAAVNACFTDPWGHEFDFRALPHDNFAVICWGEDGEDGGLARDSDFVITEREIRKIYEDMRRDMGWGYYEDDGDWQVQNLARDVLSYKDRYGELPNELADLTRGGKAVKKEGENDGGMVQAIRNSLPHDRWGNDYAYVKISDSEFYVVALGKDQLEGGIKDDEDTIFPKPGSDPREDYAEPDEIFINPVPQQDDDEVLAEVANEVMLDVVDKLKAHKADTEMYPDSLDDLAGEFVNDEVPLDPWGNAFAYALTKDESGAVTGYTLTCYGSDGAEGGDGFAADIIMNQDSSAAEVSPTED